MIARRMWPQLWRFHRIASLSKNGAVHSASNYMGLHFTPIVSKVAARVLRTPLVSYFEAVNACGDTKFAFRKQIGCHDFLLIRMCAWLLALQNRHEVSAFLSDIASSFDCVDMKKLIAKLRHLGVCDAFVDLLASFSPRDPQQ